MRPEPTFTSMVDTLRRFSSGRNCVVKCVRVASADSMSAVVAPMRLMKKELDSVGRLPMDSSKLRIMSTSTLASEMDDGAPLPSTSNDEKEDVRRRPRGDSPSDPPLLPASPGTRKKAELYTAVRTNMRTSTAAVGVVSLAYSVCRR